MNHKAILYFSLLAICFSAFLTSCSSDDDNNNGNETSTLANIMVVNASPGISGYDFYIDDALQNGNAINYNGSSPYIQSGSGNQNLKLNLTNTAVNVINRDEDLELNGNYTLITMDTAGSIASQVLIDDLSEPILGKSHIRLIHASHNSPAIDVVNLADTSVVFGNISFRQATSFKPFNVGSYALGYRLLGDSNITSLSTPVTVANQGIYTIVVSGFNSDSSGTAVSSLNVQLIDNVQ